jgi:hypothetical protein
MTDLAHMTEHGIFTSKADIWVHYHPLHRETSHQGYIFWYYVDIMRRFIKRENLAMTGGQSKNRAVTGSGFLIPKNAYPVHRRQVIPQAVSTGIDWFQLTDREASMRGEDIVQDMLLFGYQVLPAYRVERINSPVEQCNGYDLRCTPAPTWLVEVKTERVLSDNIFVQAGEHNHEPNLVNDGSRRVTPFDDQQLFQR